VFSQQIKSVNLSINENIPELNISVIHMFSNYGVKLMEHNVIVFLCEVL